MKKVLIIEDDLWLAEQYARVLSSEFEVDSVSNALSAIDVIDDFKPDVILADILLPGSSIFTLLHELQSYIDTRQIPVVLCSNVVEGISSEQARTYGVTRLLDKATIEPEDIRAAVRAAV